jgi:hypothetical protein
VADGGARSGLWAKNELTSGLRNGLIDIFYFFID